MFVWLCVMLCSGITVKGTTDRDSVRLKMPEPKIKIPPTAVLTDSIPGTFVQKLDDLYTKWYVTRPESDQDSLYMVDNSPSISLIPDSVYLERLDRMNSAIKLSFNQIVRNYIELYTVKCREQVATMLGLSEYYFPIFEEALDREGLPLELKFLPVIESA